MKKAYKYPLHKTHNETLLCVLCKLPKKFYQTEI